MTIHKQSQELVSAGVGNALPFSPPASLNLFKLSCFGANCVWLKCKAPPWHIPNF